MAEKEIAKTAKVAKAPKAEKKEIKPAAKPAVKEKVVMEKIKFVPAAIGEKTESGMKLSDVIFYPLVSEKSVGAIESQNKITFIVRQESSKQDVRNAVEKLYGVRVQSIKTLRDMHGRKKAIVRLSKEFKAQELATKLGVV